MQASNRTWDQRKPTDGVGPALPPSPHWHLNLMLFSSYTSQTSLKKEEKIRSTWPSFTATCSNLPHTLDTWSKKIPSEYLQAPAFTLDKPRYPCSGHWCKRNVSLLPALRKPTSFFFGKKITNPTWFCIYNSICACDRRQAPTG